MHLTPKFDRLYVIFVVWLFLLFAVIFTLHISRFHRIKRTCTECERACMASISIDPLMFGYERMVGWDVRVHVTHITYSFEWFNYVKHSHLHTVASVVLVQSMNRCLIQVYAQLTYSKLESVGRVDACVCRVIVMFELVTGIRKLAFELSHTDICTEIRGFYNIEMKRKWI